MAEEVIRLLRDPDRRREMGEIGRGRVERELAWDHSKRVLVESYNRLCGIADIEMIERRKRTGGRASAS